MIRITRREMELLRGKNLGKFIHSTTGHHKSWYVVENDRVLTALGRIMPKKK